MGAAAAALALGAQVFAETGHPADAARYGDMAKAIYARARESDTIVTAFERDEVTISTAIRMRATSWRSPRWNSTR